MPKIMIVKPITLEITRLIYGGFLWLSLEKTLIADSTELNKVKCDRWQQKDKDQGELLS